MNRRDLTIKISNKVESQNKQANMKSTKHSNKR